MNQTPLNAIRVFRWSANPSARPTSCSLFKVLPKDRRNRGRAVLGLICQAKANPRSATRWSLAHHDPQSRLVALRVGIIWARERSSTGNRPSWPPPYCGGRYPPSGTYDECEAFAGLNGPASRSF